jgi:hypothetical protein
MERYGPVWFRLWERMLLTPAPECRLGCEPRRRRSAWCSACLCKKPEFEIDHAIAQLISNGTIVASTECPYRAFTKSLILGLLLGPGTELTAREGECIRIAELETALKHINRAVETLAGSRDNMRRIKEDDPYFARLTDVFDAEALIANALNHFKIALEKNEKERTKPASSRGRRGDLDLQGIANSLAREWENLMGTLPGKNNTNFHNLLRGASTTIFGLREPEPDWEWATRSATRDTKSVREKLAQKS